MLLTIGGGADLTMVFLVSMTIGGEGGFGGGGLGGARSARNGGTSPCWMNGMAC